MAGQLAAAGVAFAALTDHDTVGGLPAFGRMLSRRGVGHIAGIEMTTQVGTEEAHLLGYGFDPAHAELQATLRSMQQTQSPAVHSVAGSIRSHGSTEHNHVSAPAESAAPGGKIGIAEAIELIHRAGGKAFLAHPLVLEPDVERLRALLIELKAQGLDGIEVFYGPFTDEQRMSLREIAAELGLLMSGGSDAHDRDSGGGGLGVEMPTEDWKRFRDAVCCSDAAAGVNGGTSKAELPRQRWRRRRFFFHVVFPTLLAIGLFAAAIFAVFLPAFEQSLLDRKREMIRELTNAAWSVLAGYEQDERAGVLTREQAQEMAISRIELLRYGPEGKDYFWIQDTRPVMIMHPYRKDLNGQDVSQYQDARGVRIFVAFADLVRRQRDGYIDYVWQWKDDPSRLASKESYVRGFEPWGWIIGTGIYIEDVQAEIARVEGRLLRTSVGIVAIVAMLLLYVMRRSLRIERRRSEAEESLRESTDRYRSLVEATTEGTLLVLDGRCSYANPILLEMLGCSAQELELLDLADIIPPGPDNETAWEKINALLAGEEASGGFDGVLLRRDGALIECVFAVSPITFAGRSGLILLATAVGPTAGAAVGGEAAGDQRFGLLDQVSGNIPAGLFRARATSQGTVLHLSRSADRLLGLARGANAVGALTLAAVFGDSAEYERFLAEARRDGAAERRLPVVTDDSGPRTLLVSVVMVEDDSGSARFLDGVIEDVTDQQTRAAERDETMRRLQASLLFLHEPVSGAKRSEIFCRYDASVRSVAELMVEGEASAALVQSDSGETIGIFTDRDLRERVVADGVDMHSPVHRVMSSPLVTVSERAEVYEALLAMDDHGVQHVAVANQAGRILGVIHHRELVRFRSYGPIVLTREIAGATDADQVIAACRRAPGLAQTLLDSGAHPDRVTRMLTSVCDAATERFIALAEAELGAAPAPFAFLALGSQGRQELVLSSDQDNAIVYADRAADEEGAAQRFLELGQRVCGWLNEAGYPYCTGDVMAQNPKWCQPLSVWKKYFTGWIRRSEPQQLLEFSIFFDFRAVCGASDLARDLRGHVFEAVAASPAFFPHLAQNALSFKPPGTLLGRILAGAGVSDGTADFEVKEAAIPIVSFARLYALRHGLDQTHTTDRLDALVADGALTQVSRDETTAAYELLARLRLEHQAAELDAGREPDNMIDHRSLTQRDATLLHQAFSQIAALQKRISYDFLGGT